MIVETEAIVLHSIKYGDTSKIVTLYSRGYGKIKVIAKGIRSPKNKFGSSLELMTISSVIFYKKEHRELHLLSKSEIAFPLAKLQSIPEKMFTGLAIVEAMNMAMHDEDENKRLYDIMKHSLQILDKTEKNFQNVFVAFMLKLFESLGFGINLKSCSSCKKDIEQLNVQKVFLRLSDGKFVCDECAKTHEISGNKIDLGVLKSMYFLQGNEIDKSIGLAINKVAQNDIVAILQSYLQYHVGGSRTLKSMSLLYTTQ